MPVFRCINLIKFMCECRCKCSYFSFTISVCDSFDSATYRFIYSLAFIPQLSGNLVSIMHSARRQLSFYSTFHPHSALPYLLFRILAQPSRELCLSRVFQTCHRFVFLSAFLLLVYNSYSLATAFSKMFMTFDSTSKSLHLPTILYICTDL